MHSFPSSNLGTQVFEALLRDRQIARTVIDLAPQSNSASDTSSSSSHRFSNSFVDSRSAKRSFEDARSQAGAWERVKQTLNGNVTWHLDSRSEASVRWQ